jgi:hypothetical protein
LVVFELAEEYCTRLTKCIHSPCGTCGLENFLPEIQEFCVMRSKVLFSKTISASSISKIAFQSSAFENVCSRDCSHCLWLAILPRFILRSGRLVYSDKTSAVNCARISEAALLLWTRWFLAYGFTNSWGSMQKQNHALSLSLDNILTLK